MRADRHFKISAEIQETAMRKESSLRQRITELEAENAQLREQNETQRYEIQALEEKVAELRGKRVALSDEWIRERCSHAWVFETVKHWVKEVEAAHGIGEAL